MNSRISIADLERPPDMSKGGILLPAPQQLQMRQLAAIPALLRVVRAARALPMDELLDMVGDVHGTATTQSAAWQALRDLDIALGAFSFEGEP